MKHQNVPSLPKSCIGGLKENEPGIFKLAHGSNPVSEHHLQDCYKICLFTRKHMLYHANNAVELEDATLFIEHPHSTYFKESISQEQNGYVCFYTERFLSTNACSKRLTKRLFFDGVNTLAFPLSKERNHFLVAIFRKLMYEQETSYVFKDELMHDYIDLIFHEALKMKASGYFQNR